MNACWNQMAVTVTWRVNSEKRAEQGTLWNRNSSGQEEEEEIPEKTEEWWTRPASDKWFKACYRLKAWQEWPAGQVQGCFRFSLLPNVHANTEWIDAGVSSAPRGVVWPEFRAQCCLSEVWSAPHCSSGWGGGQQPSRIQVLLLKAIVRCSQARPRVFCLLTAS